MKKKKIEIDELMSRERVAEYLQTIAAGLRQGSIELNDDEETLTLTPPDILAVEIGGKQKKDKSKFSLELSWKCQELAKGV
jgi:amphi-Trp domain-containing protein